MSSKSVLLMILAIVIGAVSLYLNSESDYTGDLETPVAIASLSQLAVDQVASIEMTMGDSSLSLQRQNQDWSIPSAWDSPADREEVSRLLADIRSIGGPEKRASSASSHGDFQVGPVDGLRISLLDVSGSSLGDLVLGKTDGPGRSFIRISGEDAVYSVTPNLLFRSGFGGRTLNAGNWTDKNLFQLPASSEIRRLTIGSSEGLVRLELEDSTSADSTESSASSEGQEDRVWMIVEPERASADATTVKGILSSLKNVQSAEPTDPSDLAAIGLEPPASFLEGELEDGSTFLLQFGHDTALTIAGQGVFARLGGQNRAVVVRTYVRDSLIKGLDTLQVPEEQPQVQPDPPADPPTTADPDPDSDG
ncbi:MAG: DUF4340 domain-containing protein [Planctomycetota bacterium]|nr:DUF4340 domain-containing protein [Planctomycetota bacterium]